MNNRSRYPVRRKKRFYIKKRFFVFLALFALILFLLIRMFAGPSATEDTAIVQQSSTGNQYVGDIVIIRNEKLYDAEGVTRVDYITEEGARVYKGEAICTVYSAGYSQTEINKLETYRQKIQQYHKESILSREVDTQLEKLDALVSSYALQIRMLVQGEGQGSLNNLQKQLTSALSSRQAYMKQKYPEDLTLATLYQDESTQLKRIESWTTTHTANEEAIVSFYTDGYESTVNAQTFDTLTLAQVKAVLNGQALETDVVSRGRQAVFRTVRPDQWYAILLTKEKDWNPVVGQTYLMQLEGYENYLVNVTVDSFSRTGSELMVRLEVDSSVEPVLSIRTGRVAIGESVTGLSVPNRALLAQQGMIGVVVSDMGVDTFVPVEVITYDDATAVVTPIMSGSPLQAGKTVRLFN